MPGREMLPTQKKYYAKTSRANSDGTPFFEDAEDDKSEKEVAASVEAIWKCEMRRFPRMSPLDWYSVRNERFVGLAELKTRSHDHDHFPTVYLNLRKWLSMKFAAFCLNVPAVFIVRFVDGIWWIRLDEIDGCPINLSGCVYDREVKFCSDREPVIEIPITRMKSLTKGTV